MKNILLVIAVVAVVIGGYFLWTANNDGNIVEDSNPEVAKVSGMVTNINSEAVMLDGPTLVAVLEENGDEKIIAVPSMGLPLCAAREAIADISMLAIGDWVEASGNTDESGQIVPCTEESDYLTITSVARDAVYEYEFTYRKGPDGYVTLEDNSSTDADFVTGLTLINKSEYEVFQNSTDAREGPPAMSVRIYNNPEKLHSSVWTIRKPLESNIELALTEPEEAVVGGANAVHYIADGLYPMDIYVVAYGQHVYVLSVMYPGTDTAIYQDFQSLVDSFTFIKPEATTGAPQGKINVQLVCEGALAYTTFPDAAAADKFVTDCIDGLHPEVIEKYIDGLGLDGAAI